jgi:hypothetical protein
LGYVCVHARNEWLVTDGIKRLCQRGDVHFTSALFASHEAPESVFLWKRWCKWHERVFWKSCSRNERLKVSDCIKGNMSMRSCCAFRRMLCLRSVDLRKSFCGNGDANDMKECSGSAVLEMERLQMWGGRQNVMLMRSCALPGCSVCIA